MTNTGKFLAFTAVAVAGFLGYQALTKKKDTSVSDESKSGFLGLNSKARWAAMGKRWCRLNDERIDILRRLQSARGVAQMAPLQEQLASTVLQMNTILSALHSAGYDILDCHVVPLLPGKMGISTGPDWEGMCLCKSGVWAKECCNKAR